MTDIYIPSASPEDWKSFLAEPDKHWKTGYSARSLAYCWHDAGGIPPDVLKVLGQRSELADLRTLIAIPEHKVPLPGGSSASQNDVWVLGKSLAGLVSIAVEGKVSEPFGPTVEEWFKKRTKNRETRLTFLCGELGLDYPPSGHVRYQLLHRAVSSTLEAKRFGATEAVMVVHSFSQTHEWFDDYLSFANLFGVNPDVNQVATVRLPQGIHLSFAWICGPAKYLEM